MGKYRVKNEKVEAWKVKTLIFKATHDWKSLPACVKERYEEGTIGFFSDRISVCNPTCSDIRRDFNEDSFMVSDGKGGLFGLPEGIFMSKYEPDK